MNFRLPVTDTMALFVVMTALGLAALIFASDGSPRQPRAGAPLDSQMTLADNPAPADYVLEAHLY